MIVLNSPLIVIALAEYPQIEVVTLGGQLYKKALVNVGAATVEALGIDSGFDVFGDSFDSVLVATVGI